MANGCLVSFILFGSSRELYTDVRNGDGSVPVSKLPQLVYETKRDIAAAGLLSTIVGHVGDGNFHALILFKTDEERERTKALVSRMVKRAIALDGTC